MADHFHPKSNIQSVSRNGGDRATLSVPDNPLETFDYDKERRRLFDLLDKSNTKQIDRIETETYGVLPCEGSWFGFTRFTTIDGMAGRDAHSFHVHIFETSNQEWRFIKSRSTNSIGKNSASGHWLYGETLPEGIEHILLCLINTLGKDLP